METRLATGIFGALTGSIALFIVIGRAMTGESEAALILTTVAALVLSLSLVYTRAVHLRAFGWGSAIGIVGLVGLIWIGWMW
jgi:hypothetical protein